MSQETLKLAKDIRVKCIEMVTWAKASHVGSSLSIADIVAVLYGNVLRLFPEDPRNPSRDRLLLSKGHACSAVYAALGLRGFFALEDLKTFGMNDSRFMTHISHKVPGVEFSTGSLGHGLPFGAGKALALKLQGNQSKVYVILGDGELDEGSNWEALLFAAHHKLDNLVVIVDNNNLQSLTTISKTLDLEPLAEKFDSFGCLTMRVDGHDHGQLIDALNFVSTDQVKVIIAKTVKGKGVSFMENSVKWHYSNPTLEQAQLAIDEIVENS
jgi:transketolase